MYLFESHLDEYYYDNLRGEQCGALDTLVGTYETDEERALSMVTNPDPRSVAAIAAKRAWLRGEISDDELSAARAAAWEAEFEWQISELMRMLEAESD